MTDDRWLSVLRAYPVYGIAFREFFVPLFYEALRGSEIVHKDDDDSSSSSSSSQEQKSSCTYHWYKQS